MNKGQGKEIRLIHTTMELMGCDRPKENPYPIFRELPQNQTVKIAEGMSSEDQVLMGYENAPRYLPYKKKDNYSRERSIREEEVIILENSQLKAVFLPNYGGRLYSLYHKGMGRELLFKNQVIQPANLAILDAWISGGIEWNIGQLGHTFTTCEPLFCSVMKDREGHDFLRMFEYERCHNVYWSMDFHLRPDSPVLEVYVRIVNDGMNPVSTYWWTNTAVPETEETRIFAGASKAIYLDMEQMKYGTCQMPVLPFMPYVDASYPKRFQVSEEYFFQEQDDPQAPWEAAVYKDWAFFERSSQQLAYRKMFCWGNQPGGNHWKDFLSIPGQGDYVEIQAGIGKTQRHGRMLERGENLEFVQCFGGFLKDEDEYGQEDWLTARNQVEAKVEVQVGSEQIQEMLKEWSSYGEEKPEEFLVYGNGFGALETWRREKMGEVSIPDGFYFPTDSMGREQLVWKNLLETGRYDCVELPVSYMIQKEWQEMLETSSSLKEGSYGALLQLGILYFDQGRYEDAKGMFLRSLDCKAIPLTYRNMALLCERMADYDMVSLYYDKALNLAMGDEVALIARDYMRFLQTQERWRDMYCLFGELPASAQEEGHIALLALKAAVEEHDLDFVERGFLKEYAYIREGEMSLSDIWLQYHIQKVMAETGNVITKEEAEGLYPVPYQLEFRMIN